MLKKDIAAALTALKEIKINTRKPRKLYYSRNIILKHLIYSALFERYSIILNGCIFSI